MMPRAVLVCGAIAAFLAGCRSVPDPPPLLPPGLETGVAVFAGDPVGGPRGKVEAIAPGEGLIVRCTLLWAEHMPWEALRPLSGATRLVLDSGGARPLGPAADLAAGARMGLGTEALARLEGAAGRVLPLTENQAALGAGLTARFHARSPERKQASDGSEVFRATSILVGRNPGARGACVALELEDFGVEEEARVSRRQVVVLEEAPEPGAPLVLALPSRHPGLHAPEALLAQIEVEPLDLADPVHAALAARSLEQAAAADSAGVGPSERAGLTLARSLEALRTPRLRRAALVFLAGEAGAPLALDLALAADEALLGAWSEALLSWGEQAGPDAFPWLLERSAYAELARRLDRDELSPGLAGLLARHAGEVGRFPGVLAGLLERADGPAALERLVAEENLAFLELEDPAGRVRAFDWLALRGLAPAGFDPLAPRPERTDALDRFFEARESGT